MMAGRKVGRHILAYAAYGVGPHVAVLLEVRQHVIERFHGRRIGPRAELPEEELCDKGEAGRQHTNLL